MATARPDLAFCVSGIAPDGYLVSVDAEGAARDAGLLDGDVIVSLDGLPLAEFRASAWWPRPHGKPIKVVYHRRGMIHRGNVVVDVFNAPVAAVCASDAPAAAAPEDHTAPDAPAAAENDVAPDVPAARGGPDTGDQLLPNADGCAQVFGRPIGEQSWRYGRRGCVSDCGGTASPTPIGHADNWGDVDNWRTSTSPQAPHVRRRDCYDR
jgi:hypothetical protein